MKTPPDCLAAGLCQFGSGEWDSPCPISDVCSWADRSGSLDCWWERRRTHLGDAFHRVVDALALEKYSLPPPNARVCSWSLGRKLCSCVHCKKNFSLCFLVDFFRDHPSSSGHKKLPKAFLPRLINVCAWCDTKIWINTRVCVLGTNPEQATCSAGNAESSFLMEARRKW